MIKWSCNYNKLVPYWVGWLTRARRSLLLAISSLQRDAPLSRTQACSILQSTSYWNMSYKSTICILPSELHPHSWKEDNSYSCWCTIIMIRNLLIQYKALSRHVWKQRHLITVLYSKVWIQKELKPGFPWKWSNVKTSITICVKLKHNKTIMAQMLLSSSSSGQIPSHEKHMEILNKNYLMRNHIPAMCCSQTCDTTSC